MEDYIENNAEQSVADESVSPAICPKCGTPFIEGQSFCSNCGTPKEDKKKAFCANCGAELTEGAVFCANCGHRVGEDVSSYIAPGIPQDNAPAPEVQKKSKAPLVIGIIAALLVIAAAVFFLLPKAPTGITLSDTSIKIGRGDTYTLTYEVEPKKVTDYEVSWRSDDDDIASVKDGVVTGEFIGTCRITVETDNGKSCECKVTVEMPEKEKKVVGTWDATNVYELDEEKFINCEALGWKLKLYDDNSGEFTSESLDPIKFSWVYSHTNDSENYVYQTNSDLMYFIYAIERNQIWLYIQTDEIDWCIICE